MQPYGQLLENGELALVLVRCNWTDAVLVDMVMRGMDGPTVLRAQGADTATRVIPCVAVTA